MTSDFCDSTSPLQFDNRSIHFHCDFTLSPITQVVTVLTENGYVLTVVLLRGNNKTLNFYETAHGPPGVHDKNVKKLLFFNLYKSQLYLVCDKTGNCN